MTQKPFIALFPKAPAFNDEVVVKGKIKDDASIFSVNFCLDCCPKPSYVAYHFKTIFDSNSVVHNFKSGTWQDEIVEENTWIDGPGQTFVLTFLFTDTDITVYTEDDGRCFQYAFTHKFDISDIKSVQLWDDFEYVDEIIFRYKNN